IYLDTDTLTVKDLSPLRSTAAFCGQEHLLWSKRRLDKRTMYFWTVGPVLSGVRLMSAQLKAAYRPHRALLRFYDRAANNAVLGFAAGHPFLSRAFVAVANLPEQERTKRFRLGTHLL